MTYDAVYSGTVRYDAVRYGMMRYDTVRYDVVRYRARYQTIRYGGNPTQKSISAGRQTLACGTVSSVLRARIEQAAG